MKKIGWPWVVGCWVLALVSLFVAAHASDYWQGVLINLGTAIALLGLYPLVEDRLVRRVVNQVIAVPPVEARATVFPPTITTE